MYISRPIAKRVKAVGQNPLKIFFCSFFEDDIMPVPLEILWVSSRPISENRFMSIGLATFRTVRDG